MAHYKGAAKEASRAAILMKKREKEMEELEVKKRKIEEEMKIDSINNKFAAHYDAIEQKLKSNTVGWYSTYICQPILFHVVHCCDIMMWFFLVGLVTLDEMRAKQSDVVKQRERQIAVTQNAAHLPVDSSFGLDKKLAMKNVSDHCATLPHFSPLNVSGFSFFSSETYLIIQFR